MSKVNVLCKQCNSVIYAEESDTGEQIAALEAHSQYNQFLI